MSAIAVYEEWRGRTVIVGGLDASVRRGLLSSTFRYDASYVASAEAFALEPALPLELGSHPSGASIPRSFQDAAPDRWGRNLIVKRARASAVREGRPLPALDERDFLLGVSDVTRQGALRFAFSRGGEFQHPDAEVPKLVRLPRLMRAAEAVARDDASEDAVKELLDAGTGSLGGARPKASVTDEDRLMIAKFGHADDQWDVMRWEKTALDLAARAGIAVPESSLVEIGGQAVHLLTRFDRRGTERVPYISALTLLEASDGVTADYLDIADALTDVASHASDDLVQLWRRIAFSIAIHNTDDHLRNHGLLRSGRGWALAPAFDVNPDPTASQRRTTLAGAAAPEEEARALVEYAPFFDVSADHARAILSDVLAAVSGWREAAAANRIPHAEIVLFEPVFARGRDALATALR